MKKKKKEPMQYLLIGTGTAFFLIMLVFPLAEVIFRSLKDGLQVYSSAIIAENTLSALKVTLIATVFAVLVNTFFGLCSAWLLTRFEFRGRQALSGSRRRDGRETPCTSRPTWACSTPAGSRRPSSRC